MIALLIASMKPMRRAISLQISAHSEAFRDTGIVTLRHTRALSFTYTTSVVLRSWEVLPPRKTTPFPSAVPGGTRRDGTGRPVAELIATTVS